MHFNTKLSLVLLIALAPSCFAQASGPKKAPAEAIQPILVIKGKEFLIHAIQPMKIPNVVGEMTNTSVDTMLVYTSLASGEMKVLVRGSTTVTPVPMIGEMVRSHHSSIVDFAVDKERLYVFKAEGNVTEFAMRPIGGGIRSHTTLKYVLLVFQPQTGKLLHTLDLERPEKDAAKKVERGALKLGDNGVEVFGTRFEFKGTELLKPAPESKK